MVYPKILNFSTSTPIVFGVLGYVMYCWRILASNNTGELAKELWVSVTAISVIHACCSEGPVPARDIDLFAARSERPLPALGVDARFQADQISKVLGMLQEPRNADLLGTPQRSSAFLWPTQMAFAKRKQAGSKSF
jgi:hypothetical protein